MISEDITPILKELFGETVQVAGQESWQVDLNQSRLLVLLSEDRSWLRGMIAIAPAQDAQPFAMQLLEANFDDTQEARYAVYEQVLWVVFQHNLATLTADDFRNAIARLLQLQQQGLAKPFNQLAEAQIRQIVMASKLQGQSLEATMQTLERFYREGVMGGVDQGAEQRDKTLEAWRSQLERLWNEVEP